LKLLQLNTTVNSGSTGRIAEDIGKMLMAKGHESWIAYGRGNQPSTSKPIRMGGKWDMARHGVITRLFDRHGFGSAAATRHLITRIRGIKPDLIHLHNIHGYYLNIDVLFGFLRSADLPVVWTLHDCWPFSGHCTYFDAVNCFRWKTGCFECPNKRAYPQSWFWDRSKKNYLEKKRIFTGLSNMTLVAPSQWMGRHLEQSFLKGYPVKVMYNGIDLDIFKPFPSDRIKSKYAVGDRKMILGVAGTWDRRKGLDDFVKLNQSIDKNIVIVLVGLNQSQLKTLPENMIGIPRTENITELAEIYSAADVFVNPTYVDNFPTTNIEALACGTPVITYNTGGSPEAVDADTGIVVEKADLKGLLAAVNTVLKNGRKRYKAACRYRAERRFDSRERYGEYEKVYFDSF